MNIIEIFSSIQGESTLAGLPTTFVRFARCNLRCIWCDTPYSFGKGIALTREEIHEKIDEAGLGRVCLTGGEPLLQEELPILCNELLAKNIEVSVETGGHMDISVLPDGVKRVCDLKTPGAFQKAARVTEDITSLLEQTEFFEPNLEAFGPLDELKIVIASLDELPWVRCAFELLRLDEFVGTVHLSPVHAKVDLAALAKWMVEERIPARLHLQVHKLIFGDHATGV